MRQSSYVQYSSDESIIGAKVRRSHTQFGCNLIQEWILFLMIQWEEVSVCVSLNS
jgi:hypothetical protein